MSLKIIFQDDHFLALEKPAGLVVDKAETNKDITLEDILISELKINLPRGGIVHRLDKDTSGILLVARTKQALENLQAQFKDRVVKKEYLALVHGLIEKAGTVKGAIGRNPGNREKFTVLLGGKEAVTEYEPIKSLQLSVFSLQEIFEDFKKIQMRKLERQKYGEFTLVKCKPKTGRTHQIRVHLKYINYPIVSDEKYVGRKMFRLDRRWCPRMFLHSAKIGFNHPEKNKWMELESKLPEDLKEALVRVKGKA
ncbi:RluA family pseudouridine synthase [Patescibacteria group bacterium]|nr:RluA family pseudouridine synthase [Patescibacteria group bacterium]